MLMNSSHLSRVGRAVSLTLVAFCVGGVVVVFHLAFQPTPAGIAGVLVGISLLVGAASFLVELPRRPPPEPERLADARLATAIAGIRAGIALFDAKDRLVVANPTYCQIHEIIADLLVP